MKKVLSIPDFSGATSLQVLRLDYNRLVGSIPDGLAKRLMVFDASHNPGLAPAKRNGKKLPLFATQIAS